MQFFDSEEELNTAVEVSALLYVLPKPCFSVVEGDSKLMKLLKANAAEVSCMYVVDPSTAGHLRSSVLCKPLCISDPDIRTYVHTICIEAHYHTLLN